MCIRDRCDGAALPFADASFDVVVTAYGVMPFVADSAGVMREVARVLRPGGRFVFSTTHPMRWAFPDDPGPQGLVASSSYFDRTPYAVSYTHLDVYKRQCTNGIRGSTQRFAPDPPAARPARSRSTGHRHLLGDQPGEAGVFNAGTAEWPCAVANTWPEGPPPSSSHHSPTPESAPAPPLDTERWQTACLLYTSRCV